MVLPTGSIPLSGSAALCVVAALTGLGASLRTARYDTFDKLVFNYYGAASGGIKLIDRFGETFGLF